MDDESAKLFKLISEGKIFKSKEIPSDAKIISMNLDIGTFSICNDLRKYKVKNTVIKKTNKVIFLKTIITSSGKNYSQITSLWTLSDEI